MNCGVGIGDGVSVIRLSCEPEFTPKEYRDGSVGVTYEGWNGVGVGEEFGAEVIKTKGNASVWLAGDAVPQAEIRRANKAVRNVRR